MKPKDVSAIDTLLLEALKSGKPIPVTPGYWKAKSSKLREMSKDKKTNRKKR